MAIYERVSGARMHSAYIRPGGLAKDLPEGFQSSEFLLEHGFLDFISHRKDLKKKVNLYIDLIQNNAVRSEKAIA